MTALELLDWRRQVHRLYAGVRDEPHPRTAHDGWTTVREQLLADHPASPVEPEHFAGLRVPAHDPAWRALVRLEPAAPRRVELPTGRGTVPLDRVGVLRTPWGPLDAWQVASYGGGLWVPVADAGSGTLSCAGGRYLYDTAEGADLGTSGDGELVVDLNFLHAPACAHDPRRAGLPAPPGNVLDVVVPVGELTAPRG